MSARSPRSIVPVSLVATSSRRELVRHSEKEWALYTMLKALRKEGFTCPGGKQFPPDEQEFEFDCRLFRASRGHSEDMGVNNYFDHTSPDGSDPFDRSSREDFGTFYELISEGQAEAAETFARWKNEQAHCEAMLSLSHTRVGIGEAHVQASLYKHYWTMLLAADGGPVDTTCYLEGAGEAPPRRGCVDAHADCGKWVEEGFCEGQYRNFMRQTCPVSCDLCGPREDETPPPTPVAGCKADESESCGQWASMGYCEPGSDYHDFMRRTCDQSCGCQGSPAEETPTTAPCEIAPKEDGDINCHFWAGLGHCEAGNEHAEMMRETCATSCGFCG